MNSLSPFLLLALLVVTAAPASAGKVYKIINPDGSVTYTDTPPAEDQHSETLNLPPINQQPTINVPTQPVNDTDNASDFSGYSELLINSPEPNGTIPPGQQTLTVTASVTPPLQPGHKLQLYYDGEPYGKPSSSLSKTLHSPLYRGSHIIQLAVISANGEQLIRSKPLTIHIKRATVNAPTRKASSN